MPLSSGTRLGVYEIVAVLGKGGMGEVYRARDTKLGREVAVKVLPEELARNEEGLARFEREARLLATLNHPGIATLHGLERDGDTRFLVMELVEGETLAERIHKGALSVRESLSLFPQIADALDAAHESGIVHRDLKPANIKITPEGRVKVLDFGLAKALADPKARPDASQSPTITREGTIAGTMLGTPAYMSPEQARGDTADRRSDLWSFGCCLYEALAGKPPFLRETVADTIAAVLEREPEPLGEVVPSLPPLLERAVSKCLEKNRSRRWQSSRDLLDALMWVRDGLTPPTASGVVERRGSRAALLVTSLAAALFGAAVVAFLLVDLPELHSTIRLEANLPSGFRLSTVGGSLAISSDGERLAYVAQADDAPFQLFVRSLDQNDSHRVEGADGAWNPFFSPDGRWIGFQARGALYKTQLSGGVPQRICEAAPPIYGAVWLADDTIVFGGGRYQGLFRVPADGGSPAELTRPDIETGEFSHGLPQPLADGEHLLFTIETDKDSSVAVLSLRTGEHQVLVENGAAAHALASGHLVFAQYGGLLRLSSSLLAAPFDADRVRLEAAPTPVVDDVYSWAAVRFALPEFAVSAGGVLVYMPADVVTPPEHTSFLSWYDRAGTSSPVSTDRRGYLGPRISPDGRRAAVAHQSDIWLVELSRGAHTRFTFDQASFQPVWKPDGTHIVFVNNGNLHWAPVDRSVEPRPIVPRGNLQHTGSWLPDGRTFAYHEHHPRTGMDIWTVVPGEDSHPSPILVTPFNEGTPSFSPNGRWMAYVSDESARFEVYVCSYPDCASKFAVSTEGGREPLWSADGRELFYRNGNEMMVVEIDDPREFRVREGRPLFEGNLGIQPGFMNRNYDVTSDGHRFLIVSEAEHQPESRLNVVIHWFDELERLVPTN